MKYKIILIIISIFLLVGCSTAKEELECEIGSTVITLTVGNGTIIKYVDEIKGELSQEEIDVLNESYLKNIDNNDDAIKILREVIANNGGNCK